MADQKDDAQLRQIALEERRVELDAELKRADLAETRAKRELDADLKREELERDRANRELDAALKREELAETRAQREVNKNLAESANELKKYEIDVSKGKGVSFTGAQATVAVAALSLLSGITGGLIQAWATRGVEEQKNAALVRVEQTKAEGNLAIEKQKQIATEHLERAKFEIALITSATKNPDRKERIDNLRFYVEAGFIQDPDGKIAKMIQNEGIPFTRTSLGSDLLLSGDFEHAIAQLEGETISSDEAERLEKEIKELVHVPLNGNQVTALASFVRNVGMSNFRNSTLLKVLNAGDYKKAADELMRWSRNSLTLSPLLSARRRLEAELFLRPTEK